MVISKKEAIKLLKNSGGKVFRVTFVKRTNNEIRNLVGRLGVTRYITGKGMQYNPTEKDLLTVFDFQKKEYRMINLQTLLELAINKKVYKVK